MRTAMRRDLVVILGGPDASETLAARVVLLNYRALPARTPEAAIEIDRRAQNPVRCLVLAEGHGLEDPARELPDLARQLSAEWVEFVAAGELPAGEEVDALRRAGVRYALWQPYTHEELRFVINLAHYNDIGKPRSDARVPTNVVAKVVSKTGEKSAILYNLSLHGAYLITPRPTLRGGRVEVRAGLPGGDAVVEADVIWNNVPGNLRKANAPIGMGVRFVDMDADVYDALRRYMKERAAAFTL
jgi:hypothetical protein